MLADEHCTPETAEIHDIFVAIIQTKKKLADACTCGTNQQRSKRVCVCMGGEDKQAFYINAK